MKLWYDRPASCWTQALPAGNGRLGAMLFGGAAHERVDLNEDTFWSGHPRHLTGVDTAKTFEDIRERVDKRRYHEAERLFEDKMSFQWGESYEPLGTLDLNFAQDGPAEDYRRELDLDEGVLSVSYRAGDAVFRRELLASVPGQVMALRLAADRPGRVGFQLTLDCPLRHEVLPDGDVLWMRAQAPSMVEPEYSHALKEPVAYSDAPGERGMAGWVAVRVCPEGGRMTLDEGGIRLEGADAATVLIAARTSFRGYDCAPDLPDERVRALCRADLDGAGDYDALRRAHVRDYRQYFDRVDLALDGPDRDDLPTDERLRRFDPEAPDMGLYATLFQYGRYLMISGSRPGTQALNLQGIWNHRVRPPWSSNYTVNINTQMNYWPALSCNLAEMELPLVDLTRDLSESGREIARQLYGARGFVCHHNTDLWRFAWPVGNRTEGCVGYAFWNMSAAWLCGMLYERYEYTLDRDFLQNTAYPIMKAAAEFLLDMLKQELDGTLIVSPATSPENGFLAEGRHTALDRTSAMSMALARELFGNCARACGILGRDEDFAQTLRDALARLRPDGVGRDGRLLEWYEEHPETEAHHRHLSHLYAAHPGSLWDLEETPKRMAAVRKALEGRGDEGTGWSLAWKVCQWARQGEGDRALRVLNMQLRLVEEGQSGHGGSYANLFCAHPPFQIDGNFGVTAGIAEMLVQSRAGRLKLLPARPGIWKKGRASGLCAKGAIRVDVSWDGESARATLLSETAQTVRVSLGASAAREVALTPGRPAELVWNGGREFTQR